MCIYWKAIDLQIYMTLVAKSIVAGYFMWAPAILGKPGQETELVSPALTEDANICFNFWFDMTVSYYFFL